MRKIFMATLFGFAALTLAGCSDNTAPSSGNLPSAPSQTPVKQLDYPLGKYEFSGQVFEYLPQNSPNYVCVVVFSDLANTSASSVPAMQCIPRT